MMNDIHFNVLLTNLLNEDVSQFDKTLRSKFNQLKDSELSTQSSNFHTSVSAVFSSKIEGEEIELDSYLKHKMMGVKFLPDYTRKIDDLYEAYQFAQQNELNSKSLREAHEIITRHILRKPQRGKIRSGMMYVMTVDGGVEYVACSPGKVAGQMEKLYADIAKLLNVELSFSEAFFFAAMLHLVFVKIHPFGDGNGRTARLLEKWFLAQKLGPKAWFLQSEKFYYDHHADYYANIRMLGIEYDLLDFSKALPFLRMLPGALATDKV